MAENKDNLLPPDAHSRDASELSDSDLSVSGADDEKQGWVCPTCTYHNKSDMMLVCELCRQTRPSEDDAAGVEARRASAIALLCKYDELVKPQEMSLAVFEKTVQLYRELDDKGYGRVRYKRIAKRMRDIYKGDLPDPVIHRLVQNRVRYKGKLIHIKDFLLTIMRAVRRNAFQNHKSMRSMTSVGARYTEQFSLFRKTSQSILVEDKSLKRYHRLGWCGRRLFDLHNWWLVHWVQRKTLIPLWEDSFKLIEAKFGSSVASYFLFARSIFWLNLMTMILFLFITIPGVFDFASYSISGNEWAGVFFGTGMENTFLFYGGYKATYYDGAYRMNLAWILLMGCMLLLALVVTLRFIGKAETYDEQELPISNLVLAGYDFNIMDERQLRLQSLRTRTAVETALKEAEESKLARRLGSYDTLRRYTGLFLTLVFVGSTSALVAWMILNEEEKIVPRLEEDAVGRYMATLLVPGAVAFFRALSPFVVAAIVKFEGYPRARDRFRNMFARNFMIQMFYIMVVLFQTILNENRKTNQTSEVCNETQVGIIYYKLLWVDLFFEFGVSVVQPWVASKFTCKAQEREKKQLSEYDAIMAADGSNDHRKPEFEIPESIVDIMYRQALIWSGAPFCPFLPTLAVFCGAFTMQIKKWQVVYFSKPPEKPMGVAHQNRYFRGVMVVTLIISYIPFTFFLRRKVECGPHNGERPIDVFFQEYVDNLPSWAALIFAYLANIVLLWLIIMLLVVYILYLTKQETLEKEELSHLRRRLKLEAREKQAIVRDNRIELDEDTERGVELFKSWIDELGAIGHRYAGYLIDNDLGDLYKLLKMEDEEVETILKRFGAPPQHVEFIVDRLVERRLELI